MRPDIKFTESQIKASTKAVEKVLSFIEAKLKTRRNWLCTDSSPSIADLAAYCEIGQCQKMYCDLIDFSPYPNVRRWMSKCETIPGYESAHAMLKAMSPRIRKRVQKQKSGCNRGEETTLLILHCYCCNLQYYPIQNPLYFNKKYKYHTSLCFNNASGTMTEPKPTTPESIGTCS